MRIAVLGGSFDPPHVGHYLVARQVLELRPDIDKVLLMPSPQHEWKKLQASVEDRLAMLEYISGDKIELSRLEIDKNIGVYTIDTLRELKKHNGPEIYWLIGSDLVGEFPRWGRKEEILKLAKFLVFPRDPYHLPSSLPKGFEVVTGEGLITTNLSSTIIRKRVREGRSIKYLVPEEVAEYIKEKKLYK